MGFRESQGGSTAKKIEKKVSENQGNKIVNTNKESIDLLIVS